MSRLALLAHPAVLIRSRWTSARLSGFLGKYIILAASVLHIIWAGLLLIDPSASGATPLHILAQVCGGRYRTAFVLVLVAVNAIAFPFIRLPISNGLIAIMLLPQQVILLMSAGAGLYGGTVGRYADGTPKSAAFIIGDQLPMLILALLYVVTVLQVSASMAKRRKAATQALDRASDA